MQSDRKKLLSPHEVSVRHVWAHLFSPGNLINSRVFEDSKVATIIRVPFKIFKSATLLPLSSLRNESLWVIDPPENSKTRIFPSSVARIK